MSAVIVEIAEAVVAAIEAATLSQPATVERAYVPVHERTDLADLTISVVPTAINTTLLDRTPRHMHEYTIDVGIQQAAANELTTLDPLMLVAQEIMDLFRGLPLTGYTAAKCTDAQNQPIFVPEHLDEMTVFTSVVRLVFSLAR